MQALITVQEAENLIREHLATPPLETVSLTQAQGRYLGEDILADRPLPPFDRVMMDGIAIRFASYESGKKSFPIAATQAAGAPTTELTDPNTCIEVMTGGVLPKGCDCVIPVEHIDVSDNAATLHSDASPAQGQHIHLTGSDTSAGQVLLRGGQLLNAPELTIAASCGATSLMVAALPRILIISTGDELVAPEQIPLAHQIRRSHATALNTIITSKHLGHVETIHVSDNPGELTSALSSALNSHDILVITGGVSRGKYDYVAPVLKKLLGDPLFHGIAQRPGKPMAFWSHDGREECKRAIRADDGSAAGREECKRAIFALPGNPVSVMACATRYLIPALTEMLSGTQPTAQKLPASGSFNCPPEFTGLTACRVTNGRIQLLPPSNSGNFLALADTHGIAELPGNLARKELLNEPATFYPWT